MSFGKQILSSIIGSTIGLLLTGGVLIVIFVAALVGGLAAAFGDGEPDPFLEVEDGTVLRLTLDEPILERGVAMPLPGLSGNGGGIGLDEIQNALERAAEDERIQGLLLQVTQVDAAPATILAVRRAIADFKASGKWVIYWSETASMSGMYLGSVADEVYMHPQGGGELAGMRLQTTFFTGMLEKIGVKVNVLRGPDNAYKGAVEPFMRKDLSPENREQLTALLEDIWAEMRKEWAQSRGMQEAALDSIATGLAFRTPEDGVRLGLLDGLKYADELDAHLRERLGERPILTDLNDYLLPEDFFGISLKALENWDPSARKKVDAENRDSIALGGDVAIIYAVGAIESGKGDDVTIGSETISEALRRARLAPDVKAVVLRVNSPGGSALASDVIWRETALLRAAGKPLVVSMGDYAASGGYYISAAATKIFAEPTTITGSIGVFGMIPDAQALLEDKMGLSFDEVSTHPHAGMGIDRPLDEVQIQPSTPPSPTSTTRSFRWCRRAGACPGSRSRRWRGVGFGPGGMRWTRGWWMPWATWRTPWRRPPSWRDWMQRRRSGSSCQNPWTPSRSGWRTWVARRWPCARWRPGGCRPGAFVSSWPCSAWSNRETGCRPAFLMPSTSGELPRKGAFFDGGWAGRGYAIRGHVGVGLLYAAPVPEGR